ncbi:hypothetical protein C0Q70_01670 [Pomacea canaliculata]|uniref:Zinc finger ZZ-type and EF-hand domain containing 1 n=1 Tax=Pomacea canaliculata TaxID=400727 RepID=A0A2T7Q043_POMCA|nr:hypothetical protein C0Q70_01670 [Pomacea canaliculata]
MGNSASSYDSEDEGRADYKEVDDGVSDTEVDLNDKDGNITPDLHALFSDPTALRTVAAKIKEQIPENVIHQHHNHIIRWLKDRMERLEETVTIAQFCDMLMGKGVSREDAIKAFQPFDTDGNGTAEVTTMIEAVSSFSSPNLNGELGKNIRMLQACSLLPGFVDIYAGDTHPIAHHGEKILRYLLKNRAESSNLPFPHLTGFNNTCCMRLSVLKNVFNTMKDAARDEGEDQLLAEGEELKPITKCYSRLEVSTNSSDAYRLTNGDPNSFWQSDGAARSHWIRLYIRSNVVIKQLSISVASCDQSYMPELATVSGGRGPRSLRELKEIRIPSHVTGDVVLLKNVKVHYPVIQINIKRCHSDGCDTRVHGIKTIGYKVVRDTGISVVDASAKWYLQVLAATVVSAMPHSAALCPTVLEYTRNALEHMPPLSLGLSGGERPYFLSRHVLEEMETFIKKLTCADEKPMPEGLSLLLSLNLARGHVASLLHTIKYFHECPELSLPCVQLLQKMLEIRNSCWEKMGTLLQVTLAGCDGGKHDDSSVPFNVLSHGNATGQTNAYITEEGKTKVNMFFKSSEMIQLTKVRLKVVPGSRGPRRGLIFVFNTDQKEFQMEEALEKFAVYDKWGDIEYKFSVQVRNAGVGGKPDNPVAYFTFDDDCDEIDVPVSWHPVGQYILVKFLEPRQESAQKLGIVEVKFYGFVKKHVFGETELKIMPPSTTKRGVCGSPDIAYWVLNFLVDLSQDQETAELLFEYLCKVIDDPKVDHKSKIYRLSEQLIVDGASLFFPDKEAKRQRLFSMMNNVDKLTTAPSVSLVFQSLCQFFSSVDPRGLLELPKVPTESFEPGPVLEVMQTLVLVAGQEFAMAVSRDDFSQHMTYLICLTGSLQTSLMVWCWQQLTDSEAPEQLKEKAMNMVITYSTHVASKAVEACQLLQKKDQAKVEELVREMNPAFLSSIVRQLVLILMFLVDKMDSHSCVTLLHSFYPLSQQLSSLEKMAPALFPEITSENWCDMKNDDIVLRTWDVESPHNYDNNSSIAQLFSCPGATKFIVNFDPRCETERRYDYLEFTDSKGVKIRYDQKVGTSKWPKQVYFSGPHLHFSFRSDSSNTEWGYKFKVTAKGSPDVPLSWPYDLQLSLTQLFGSLCGATLASNPVMTGDRLSSSDESEQDVLRSELWTTLFRGGYMVGTAKLQRTLSGKFVSEEHTPVLQFLKELTSQSEISQENGFLIEKLKERFLENRRKGSVAVGGPEVDAAVISVFAALVWHAQQLRDDMDKFMRSNGDNALSEGIVHAFSTAESLRLLLASQKQKFATLEEDNLEHNPVLACMEKAHFLLKFAGLTRVQLKNELRSKTGKLLRKSGNKKFDKQSVRVDISEKYPSFRLVMEFVQDPAWTTERVHQMLQERSKFATSLSRVYMFASEFVRVMSKDDIFQIPVVLFLQSMLSYQDKFAKHYADGLDGCGLQQENNVRSSYYCLVRRLLEPFQTVRPHAVNPQVLPAYDFIQACLLHLLDTQWQPYDLSFISELKLPELFFTMLKDTVKMRDVTVGSEQKEEELKDYEQCLHWFDECSKGFSNWYKREEDASKEEKKAIQMFIARFSDLLDVEITCDGCGNTLPGRRYRCVQCVDLDLCTTCFSGGVKPEGEHSDDHEFIHLVYKCNKCQAFIVGTRIHCNICEDFDLCLGCHAKKEFPTGHSASHCVTEIPLVKLKNSQASDSVIKAYIHQHIWLLFTSVCLSLSDIIYNTDNCMHFIDADYIRLAAQLQNHCITISAKCLDSVPLEAEDVVVDGTPNLRMSTLPLETRQEESFATHSQERIMGLLGAMIPPKDKEVLTENAYPFTDSYFINLLLRVYRGDNGHEMNSQHLAMGLLARVLASSDIKTTGISLKESIQTGSEENLEKPTRPGQETVEHFFNFGAKCLETGLEWACSVARLLGTLSKSDAWQEAVHSHITGHIEQLVASSVVLTVGTLVEYSRTTLETKKGVVIKHFPDKHLSLIVDRRTRKRYTVKDSFISCQNEVIEIWEDTHISHFTSFIMEAVARIRGGEESSVESLWMLALVLKALNSWLKSNKIFAVPCVFRAEFIQSLVSIASKGTGLSQQWLLKDLEVLSLMLYSQEEQPPGNKKSKLTKKDMEGKKMADKQAKESDTGEDEEEDNDDNEEEEEDERFDEDISSSSLSWEDEDETKVLFGKLDEKTKRLFEALHHDLKVPMAVLRVMYEMNEGNLEAVIKAIMENFENSEEIASLIEKWKGGGVVGSKSGEKQSQDRIIDTGIHFHPLLTRTGSGPSAAKEETGETHQDLFLPSDRLAGEISEQRRTRSGELLKKELQKHGRFASRDYLARINMAMAVLYARHVLTGLLAHWPQDGPVINATLLGCREVAHMPCVLDLLYKSENKEFFCRVVQKVILHCDPNSLIPIAYTASQFMEEVTMSAVVRESTHNYTSGHPVEKIQLPGASFLTITFDTKCSTAEDTDILQFSTSEDMSTDVHAFSGSKPRWSSFQVPGDMVYFKFIMEGDHLSSPYWGYKFTVTAGTRDSFETGYTVLESILSSPVVVSLPLGDLWQSLAYVACKQTSNQRLKAIQLLLRIVATQRDCLSATHPKTPPSPGHKNDFLSLPPPLDPTPPPRLQTDLSLLRPLWVLYNKMTGGKEDCHTMQQSVVRALTELFLQVENLALEAGIVNTYLASMADINDIKTSLEQGLMNIAIVSMAACVQNTATEFFEKKGLSMSQQASRTAGTPSKEL